MKKKIILALNLIWISMTILTGCTLEASNTANAQELDGDISVFAEEQDIPTYYYLPVGTYDSADTAILENVDTVNRTVTLYNTYAGKTYTLRYDGTTYASDKYGTTMSMAQLSEGTIVNVNFLKSSKLLVDIQVSPEAWTYDNVTKYDLGGLNSTASIGDRTYALTEGVRVFSQGENTDLMSIVSGDSISVSGIGYDIYSIRVETGHGYVRLSNESSLIGGWIEIGNTVISQVSEDMLIPVPEGEYSVKMYNKYSSVSQDILVERNQEVILDCSDIVAPKDVYGSILFHVSPENAKLYLDGEEKNILSAVKATYGIHQIEVSASGYDTLTKYINVGTELSDITVRLDETREIDVNENDTSGDSNITVNNPTVSSNTTGNQSNTNKNISSNTTSGNTLSGNKVVNANSGNRVYIYYPEGVEVYVDGVYQGLTPMSFKKVAGTHTLILKKSGYETKSYTIYLYDDGDDINISFSALDPVGGVQSNATNENTNSGSNSSQNSSQSGTSNASQNNSQSGGSDAGQNSSQSGASDSGQGGQSSSQGGDSDSGQGGQSGSQSGGSDSGQGGQSGSQGGSEQGTQSGSQDGSEGQNGTSNGTAADNNTNQGENNSAGQ